MVIAFVSIFLACPPENSNFNIFLCISLSCRRERQKFAPQNNVKQISHLEEEALSHRGGAKHQQNTLRGGGGEGV